MNRIDELRKMIDLHTGKMLLECDKVNLIQAILQSEQERLKKRLKKAYWQGFYDCANDRGTFEG